MALTPNSGLWGGHTGLINGSDSGPAGDGGFELEDDGGVLLLENGDFLLQE